MSLLVDACGTLGAVVLLYAYAMLSMAKISGDSLAYQLMNLGGAVALMVNSAYHFAWPSAILNLVWVGIGLLAVRRLATTRPWRGRHRSHR